VEEERLLPMLLAKDTTRGVAEWSGTYLVNPWEDGRLVDLTNHPLLQSYFEQHAAVIRARHVAQRNERGWFRTIDRVEPDLAARPKLLLPDLKAHPHPILDTGNYYPHHNLYFVTSQGWDLEVLGGLLLSDIADLFVGTYCVKMRGGCYRFQAQYLRRIRVPALDSIPKSSQRSLAVAFDQRDVEAASAVAHQLYGISQ
jgi:adenine-specific DNA-methyltransferase